MPDNSDMVGLPEDLEELILRVFGDLVPSHEAGQPDWRKAERDKRLAAK